MKGFIDIHSHILPQLDDGSDSMEQTISMIKIAEAEGISTIITTPHYHEGQMMMPYWGMEECRIRVQAEADIQQHAIKFLTGCEIYYSHESVKRLNAKQIPTLANSRYILVEFSPVAELRTIKTALQDFLFEGYLPILAHTERYRNLTKSIEHIEDLISLGAYIQVNSMSITGETGYKLKRISRRLLKKSLVHFVATDSHSDRQRAPKLKKCAKYITRKYGEAYTRELLIDNPSKIISNESI